MKQIKKTKWARNFKKECPQSYLEAIEFASKDKPCVDIFPSDESGIPLWVISPIDDPGFWLDAKDTKEKAIELCKTMNWEIMDEKQ